MIEVHDVIAAVATPPGKGGVGIIRVSGPNALTIIQPIIKQALTPRLATYLKFYIDDTSSIDQGIALFFQSPHSFTGEDIVELHCHGGPIVLDMIMSRLTKLGVRVAKPGEFSERAFLNDKIDLAQAEAIADLIDANSEQAAKSAIKSLQGDFSKKVNEIVESLIRLRLYVEASIDFPEEEIDFLSDGKVKKDLLAIEYRLNDLMDKASQGAILRDGMNVVLAGKPNAGKSSLLNALSGKDSAIVTEYAGTTRDVLREHIVIDGLPIHVIDTAGIRESNDSVEKIGIQRAKNEIENADRLLIIVDSTDELFHSTTDELIRDLKNNLKTVPPISLVYNKSDLHSVKCDHVLLDQYPTFSVSAKTGLGLDLLKQHLKECIGFDSNEEGVFIARRRHLDAITRAQDFVSQSKIQLLTYNAGELVAEDLRLAQEALNEITGEFSADDLLGHIFSSFCIGK